MLKNLENVHSHVNSHVFGRTSSDSTPGLAMQIGTSGKKTVGLGTATSIRNRKMCPFCGVVEHMLIQDLFAEPHANTSIYVQLVDSSKGGIDSVVVSLASKPSWERRHASYKLSLYYGPYWGIVYNNDKGSKQYYQRALLELDDKSPDPFHNQWHNINVEVLKIYLQAADFQQELNDAYQEVFNYVLGCFDRGEKPEEELPKRLANFFDSFGADKRIIISDQQTDDLMTALQMTRDQNIAMEIHTRTDPPVPMLLIDVDSMCIIEAKGGEKYVALSYVWGNSKAFTTNKSNKKALMGPGGLNQGDLIPKVIRDAITFTKNIDIKYLKLYQIERMNIIYQDAYLTLVAWVARDGNTPLPGVNTPLEPQVVRRLVNKILLENRVSEDIPFIEEFRRISHYETRAWTFQERLLSKRCLFFHHREALLYIPSIREITIGINSTGYGKISHFNQMHSDGSEGYSDTKMAKQLNISVHTPELMRYVDLVERYSQLNLINSRDKVKAFTGLLSHLRDETGPCVQGLPIYKSPMCLTWKPLGSKSLSRNTNFPSWTWAGVHGPISFMGCFLDWTRIQINEIRGSEVMSQHEWVLWSSKEPEIQEADIIPYSRIFILHFSALTVKVDPNDLSQIQLIQALKDDDPLSNLGVSDCDFILISRGVEGEVSKTYVMLIKWTGECAERVAIVAVKNAAWDCVTPQLKEIHLK
ncbi:hypothetical protein F5884DRAFT_885675 [Xylogone sp. PMI_703]|nr:hypothetical protein F5884DRAFT_885675 [Xylogone sp. PMI_703]